MNKPTFLSDLMAQSWAMEPGHLAAFLVDVECAQGMLAVEGMVPTDDEPGSKPALNVRDGVAHIAIDGPMLKRVSPMLKMFGLRATSTVDVGNDIDRAMADESVKSIMLDIDSPGGVVSGVSELADKVAAANLVKPVRAHASDMAASAAYWVMSQCRLASANPSAMVGSIGVYNVMVDSSAAAAKQGLKVNVVSSAPLKGAGVDGSVVTDEQIADSQRLVNNYAEMFNAAVCRGRRMADAAPVATGQVWLAADAVARGLVDHVCSAEQAHQVAAFDPQSRPAIVAQTEEDLSLETAEAISAEDSTTSPQPGAMENNMAEKNEAGAGTPVTAEDEIKQLRLRAAKAEALEAQIKAIRAQQDEALIAKYSDRVAPAARAGMLKAVAAYEDLNEAEAWVKSLPVITRAKQDGVSVQSGTPTPAAERISDGDKEAMRLVGANGPEHLRSLEKAAELVESVTFDGRAKLKDGRIVTREQLSKLIGYVAALVIALFSVDASATALSQARMTNCKGTPSVRQYLMAASKTIYSGGLVMVNSSGTVEAAAASASNAGVAGVAQETKTSAASGSYWINVASGIVCKFGATSIAQTAVGDVMYAADDQTVDETQGSNQPVAGVLVHYVSATSGWLLVDGGINMGRTNTITSPVTLAADLTLASAEVIDNDTDGTVYFKGAGATNNEDLGIDLETTANTATLASSTGVIKVDFGAIGTTLQLANDQTIISDTNGEIQFSDASEDTSLGFATSNEVTVTTDTGVTRWNFEDIGVKTTNPLFITKSQRFCGNGSNATTAWYIGPVSRYIADESTYGFGGAGCDALDSGTEATADAPASDGAAPLYVFAMRCTAEAGGADDVNTFQMRSATADVTGMTCAVTNDGAANKTCTVILNAPVTIAAGATVAIKNTQATDDDMSAKDAECEVFYTFK